MLAKALWLKPVKYIWEDIDDYDNKHIDNNLNIIIKKNLDFDKFHD